MKKNVTVEKKVEEIRDQVQELVQVNDSLNKKLKEAKDNINQLLEDCDRIDRINQRRFFWNSLRIKNRFQLLEG